MNIVIIYFSLFINCVNEVMTYQLRQLKSSVTCLHPTESGHSIILCIYCFQCCTQVTCVKSESSPKSLGSSLKSLYPSRKSLGTNFKSVLSLYRLKDWKFTCRPTALAIMYGPLTACHLSILNQATVATWSKLLKLAYNIAFQEN